MNVLHEKADSTSHFKNIVCRVLETHSKVIRIIPDTPRNVCIRLGTIIIMDSAIRMMAPMASELIIRFRHEFIIKWLNFSVMSDHSQLIPGITSLYMGKSPARALSNAIDRFPRYSTNRKKRATTWTYQIWCFSANSCFFALILKFRKMSLEFFPLNF